MPLSRRALPLAIGLLVAACSTPALSAGEGAATSSPAIATSESAAPSDPEPTPSAAPSAIAETPPPLALEEVATGLNAPINITATPDSQLLVNERDGRLVAVDPATGAVATVVDLTGPVRGGGEQGLLGLALHPQWPDEPLAFLHYTDEAGATVVSEFRATTAGAPPVLDASSERVLLQVAQPYANHNGGQLAFGPDGYLYIGLGDGGSGGDPHLHGQNPATLLGSVLRIDVGATEGDPAYAIPPDNPFADGADGAPEVFLYGLRNPWRFSFDRATELLWIGDVGQGAWEEIDRVDPTSDAGANLGWNVTEGAHCYADQGCSPDEFVLPVSEYDHGLGCSVTGGYVYRGSAIGDLAGWYLFSDYCSGLLFGVRSDAEPVAVPQVLLETGIGASAFGEGADAELYLADINGGDIYRIVAGG